MLNSPRTDQSSRTQTNYKITEHITVSLERISIRFLFVKATLYNQRIGDSRYRTWSLRFRRLRFTARTGTIEHGASFQSSPKISGILITRLICIQWKSWRFLSPGSMACHLRRTHNKRQREKKRNSCILESRSSTASSTNNNKTWNNENHRFRTRQKLLRTSTAEMSLTANVGC